VLSPLGYLAKYEEFVPKVLSTINAVLRSREQAGAAADEGAKQWEVFL
jgi:hypothetical protein